MLEVVHDPLYILGNLVADHEEKKSSSPQALLNGPSKLDRISFVVATFRSLCRFK